MKVWVVTCSLPYEGTIVEAVKGSKEAAERCVREFEERASDNGTLSEYSCEEFEVTE